MVIEFAKAARMQPMVVRRIPRIIILLMPYLSCQRPARNMKMPTAESMKKMVDPVAPLPT